MKKAILLIIVLVLVLGICSTAFAATCSHNNWSTKIVYKAWKKLQTSSDEYSTTHYRDVYLRKTCKTCGVVDEYFDYVDWGSHTLPCSLCGAK